MLHHGFSGCMQEQPSALPFLPYLYIKIITLFNQLTPIRLSASVDEIFIPSMSLKYVPRRLIFFAQTTNPYSRGGYLVDLALGDNLWRSHAPSMYCQPMI